MHHMITMHALPRQMDGQMDGRMNIMAKVQLFVLTNASCAKMFHKLELLCSCVISCVSFFMSLPLLE